MRFLVVFFKTMQDYQANNNSPMPDDKIRDCWGPDPAADWSGVDVEWHTLV